MRAVRTLPAVAGLLLLLVSASCLEPGPDQAFRQYWGAMQAGDPEDIRGYIAESWLELYEQEFELYSDTLPALVEFLGNNGVQVTLEEVSGWTSDDYFAALVTSPWVSDYFDEGMRITGSSVNGDTAVVRFTTYSQAQAAPGSGENRAILVREEDGWKVTNR